jgi:hypothetical protein
LVQFRALHRLAISRRAGESGSAMAHPDQPVRIVHRHMPWEFTRIGPAQLGLPSDALLQ